MRIPVTSNSSIAKNQQPDIGSTSSPVMNSVQKHAESGIGQHLKSDFMSQSAVHERPNEPAHPSEPIRRFEIAGVCSDGGRHLLQVVDLADVDSFRKLGAILDCAFDGAADQPCASSSQPEDSAELLDFSIDLEQMLANKHSPEQDRPKGILLKFESLAHMKTAPGGNSRRLSTSTGSPAKVIEFRRPQSFNG